MSAFCQKCGQPGPTRAVRFHRHIGLVIVFLHQRVGGDLCERCERDAFLSSFWITALVGWWGIISVFATMFFLPYDLVHHWLTRRSFRLGRETDGRVTYAALAGGLTLFGSLASIPLLLLLLLSSLAASLRSPDEDPSLHPYAALCSGDRSVSDAPTYEPGDVDDVLAFTQREGAWRVDTGYLPTPWRDEYPDQAELVVCVGPEREEVIERCPYPSETETRTIVRTSYPRAVRIIAARTGVEVAHGDVEGVDPPAPCTEEETFPTGMTTMRRSGARVQPDDVAAFVERAIAH
jgi:hypothetical protein